MKCVVRLDRCREFLRNEYDAHGGGVFGYVTGSLKEAQQFNTVTSAEDAIALFAKQLKYAIRRQRTWYKNLPRTDVNAKRMINPATGKEDFVQVFRSVAYSCLHDELPKFRVQKLWTRSVTHTITTAVDI